MFCPNCGAPISEEMAFCTNCGAALRTEAGEMKKAAAEAQAQAAVEGPNQVGAEAAPEKPASRPFPGKAIAIAAIVVIAAAAVGAGVLFATESGPFAPRAVTVSLDGGDGEATAEERGTVGDYTGMRQEDAQEALEDDGFALGKVEEEHSDSVDEGYVISQDVEAGSRADDGTAIGLVVSSGPAEHSYTLVEQDLTWAQAEAYCEDHGGYLACITSAEEDEKVKELVRGSGCTVFWIGAMRGSDGEFTWIDGEKMAYTDWAAGEPNDDGGNEDVAAIFHTSEGIAWYDTLNDVSAYYRPDTMAFIMETEEE